MPAAEDAQLLQKAVREAGALALSMQNAITHRHKPDGSLITDADLAVNELLHDRLARQRPAFGWLSEESKDDPARLGCKYCWIVDPIDGTRSYSHQGTSWCIGACLVHNRRPELACLFHPATERVFFAAAGQGTTLNGNRLWIGEGSAVAGARVMGSERLLSPLVKKGARHIPAHDVPLLARLALLASGQLDVVVSTGPKHDWDLATGELLVTEAGGHATGLANETLLYNGPERQQSGLVAAAPARHNAIMKILELS